MPLPPLPSRTARSATIASGLAKQHAAANKANATPEQGQDLSESDDDNAALSSASTAPTSQPGTRPASKKRRKDESNGIRAFHASLTEALRVDEERKDQSLLGIHRSDGLQDPPQLVCKIVTRDGKMVPHRAAEELFRSVRPVHNSDIVEAPPPPRNEGQLVRDAKNKLNPNSVASRPVCPHDNCPFLDSEQHMVRSASETTPCVSCIFSLQPHNASTSAASHLSTDCNDDRFHTDQVLPSLPKAKFVRST